VRRRCGHTWARGIGIRVHTLTGSMWLALLLAFSHHLVEGRLGETRERGRQGRFSDGSRSGPKCGTCLTRARLQQRFTVKYSGMGAPASPTPGTLVIVLPNDNFSWTYKFQVREGERGRGKGVERGTRGASQMCARTCAV